MEYVRVLLSEHVPNFMDARNGCFKLKITGSDMFNERYLIVYGSNEPICLMLVDKYVLTPGEGEALVYVSFFGCFPEGTDFTELKQGDGRHYHRIYCDISAMLNRLGAGSLEAKPEDIFDPQAPSEAKRRVGLMFGVSPDKVKISIDF
ncbi:hypothetical protein [Pseudomonas aeruginosa]|uniref:hypothetical protein n=1 Tax=Pseudomonas aeruginosa TaxID=287 RepID=UPI001AEDF821|nr:hypothetical protein [Pseudomonas aeruginosa]QTQ95424.1 hypothetical protein J9247_17000 [Pseudomonas aeruginosa]WCV27572.1 hypothetical protein KKY54_12305 [Pseudomonas aeruginosa]HBP6547151.1 hypothetical protein [Pseudomonas aeruginosa]HEP7948044.1 hypothetical protein [Pseudomonas aeruginosa]